MKMNQDDLNLAERFARILVKNHMGIENVVTNAEICESYNRRTGRSISPERVKRIVNHIRSNGMAPGLLITNKGYHVSADPGEILEYVSELEDLIDGLQKSVVFLSDHVRDLRVKQAKVEVEEISEDDLFAGADYFERLRYEL